MCILSVKRSNSSFPFPKNHWFASFMDHTFHQFTKPLSANLPNDVLPRLKSLPGNTHLFCTSRSCVLVRTLEVQLEIPVKLIVRKELSTTLFARTKVRAFTANGGDTKKPHDRNFPSFFTFAVCCLPSSRSEKREGSANTCFSFLWFRQQREYSFEVSESF